MTDRQRLSGPHHAGPGGGEVAYNDCLFTQVRHAVDARIDVVQIRERDLDARQLFILTTRILAITRGTGTRVVVNDRVDVALAAGADGVHLRADSMPPAAARSLAPRGFILGRSVHTVEEAVAADSGVDYLIAGSVWPTESKPAGHQPLGLDGLAAIARSVRVPVVAIGGVRVETAPEVARAGAAGVAGIGLFMSAPDPAHPGECRAEPLGERAAALRRGFGIT